MSCRRNFFVLMLPFFWTVPTAAECLPHYKPEKLVLYSDLVVLAKQISPREVQIEKVLKGTWAKKALQVPLSQYPPALSIPGQKGPELSGRVVLFLARNFSKVGK